MSNSSDGYFSTKDATAGNDYDGLMYVIRQALSGAHHCALVKVVAVDGDSVDVQPMVNMVDGQGNAIPHGVVNGLRFIRTQGGGNAVIIDPKIGDIGLAIVADADTSSVIAAGDVANPGSMRRNDLADGFYIGGVLNGDATQYISFTDAGIKIYSPTLVHIEAPKVEIIASDSTTITTGTFTVNGTTQFNGPVTASDKVTAPNVEGTNDVVGGGKSLNSHKHGLVRAGTDQSGTPL